MCGIFAIYSNKTFHINFLIDILENLKHRGKDSYGITFITQNNKLKRIKSLESIEKYDNNNNNNNDNDDDNNDYNNIKIGMTHNRYSTTKNKSKQAFLDETQPLQFKNNFIEFDLVHNGNISNISKYISYDENLSDTQNIINFFNNSNSSNFESVLIDFINTVHCSYSIIILFNNVLYVLRDKYAYKPLFLGTIYGDYCVISEDHIPNFNKIREVNAGEIIKITQNKYETIYQKNNPINSELKCIFEYIYFMNENSSYNDHNSVYNIRKKLGYNLGSLEKINFDPQNTIVVGSPNTAIPMGVGYAKYLNLEYIQVLKKRTDCGRTFILKDQNSRLDYCKKFIFDTKKIQNKSIILIDDSLVRGNTVQSLSHMFYENGCKELHIRICSPELKHPCYYGIDIPTSEELIINNFTISEIENKFNLSSLRYITIEKMLEAFGENNGFCCACFNGNYNKELDW